MSRKEQRTTGQKPAIASAGAISSPHQEATLRRLTAMEQSLDNIAGTLFAISSDAYPDQTRIRNLQDMARIATSLILGYVNIAEMREKQLGAELTGQEGSAAETDRAAGGVAQNGRAGGPASTDIPPQARQVVDEAMAPVLAAQKNAAGLSARLRNGAAALPAG